MIDLLEKLHIKTIALAIVLAAGLCWPVLYITQIEPRDREIINVEKEISKLRDELKTIKAINNSEKEPLKHKIQVLIEENTRIKSEKNSLSQQLEQYSKDNRKLVLANNKLTASANIFNEIHKLQKAKDTIESSISFQSFSKGSKKSNQLKRKSSELQARIMHLQEKL